MGCKAKNLVILWAIVSVGVCVAGGQSTTQTALSDKGSENSSGSPSNLEPTNHHKQLISGRYQTNQWKPLKNSKYLTYIFRKYGSGGVITFEGLEHLMHSLDLGGLQFSPSHTVEEHHPEGYKEEFIIDGVEESEKSTENGDDHEGKTDEEIVKIKLNNSPIKEVLIVHETRDHEDDKTEKRSDDEADNYLEKDDPSSSKYDAINFMELHDPKHRHPRYYDHHSTTVSCMTPVTLIRLLDQKKRNDHYKTQRHRRHFENDGDHENIDESDDIFASKVKITPALFVDIVCPALLTQIEKNACGNDSPMIRKHSSEDQTSSEKKLFQFAWIYASISILIISLCGLIGVAIVPLSKNDSYEDLLQFLVALAVGTLCGDALMHLLPHALLPHIDHGDDNLVTTSQGSSHASHEAVYLCGCAFVAALFMYILETLLPLVYSGVGHNHSHHHGHDHQHHRNSSFQNDDTEPENTAKCVEDFELELNFDGEKEVKRSDQEKLTPVAFMVILGDGLHNVTDGLAIGAAFAFDPITGMATALAVLCHELPHELGDFALLLKTGVSIRRALTFNLFSSILSFIGMAIGLFVAGIHTSVVRWIYAGTAGTFLYIAMADLMPEMGKGKRNLKTVLLQILGIFLGGVIMLLIALNEDRLRILFE